MSNWVRGFAAVAMIGLAQLATADGAAACRVVALPATMAASTPVPNTVLAEPDLPPTYKPNPQDPCDVENNPFWAEFAAWQARQPSRVGQPPRNTAPPLISGITREGETLTSSDGSWDDPGPKAYVYQWSRCTAAGDVCSDIVGARAKEYILTSADVGFALYVVVRAGNALGFSSSSSPSARTALIEPAPIPQVASNSGIFDSVSLADERLEGTRVDASVRQSYVRCYIGEDPTGQGRANTTPPAKTLVAKPVMYVVNATGFSKCETNDPLAGADTVRIYKVCLQRFNLGAGMWRNYGDCTRSVARGIGKHGFEDVTDCDRKLSSWRLRITQTLTGSGRGNADIESTTGPTADLDCTVDPAFQKLLDPNDPQVPEG